MQREQRLRSPRDFASAYRTGRVVSNHLLVVRIRPNDLQVSRFGFVVGKAHGGAVKRNRIKRRLREAARAIDVQPGYDVVIGVRQAVATAAYADLQQALRSLINRAGIAGEISS